jgi:hypothetical protein
LAAEDPRGSLSAMTTSPVVDPAHHLVAAEVALAAEFPSVPADTIHELIVDESRNYEVAKVRDFVPLLVARTVRTRLREASRTA